MVMLRNQKIRRVGPVGLVWSPAVRRLRPAYSVRSAALGSTAAARRAGSNAEGIATETRMAGAPAIVAPSVGLTPNNIEEIRRPVTTGSARPAMAPAAARARLPRSNTAIH